MFHVKQFYFLWGISSPKPPDRRTRRGEFLVYATTARALFSKTDERDGL